MLGPNKSIAKIDSITLTEYIVFKYGPMSHLKLQKLLFYTDALHLAFFDEEVITDSFEAWLHGPVSRKVYNTIRDFSILYNEIKYENKNEEKTPDIILKEELTEEQIDLIDEVLAEYSKLNHLQLETLSHQEKPWLEARKGFAPSDKCTVAIDKQLTKVFYKDKVYGRQTQG